MSDPIKKRVWFSDRYLETYRINNFLCFEWREQVSSKKISSDIIIDSPENSALPDNIVVIKGTEEFIYKQITKK